MGTDIHLWLETRENADAAWQKVGAIFPYRYFDPKRPANEKQTYGTPGEPGYEEWIRNPEFVDQPYQNRHYTVFALLADVRNGTGVAGVLRGSKVMPIAEPRGFPEDASPELRAIYDREFEHTACWLMAEEVLAYNYDQPYAQVGVMSAEEYEHLLKTGEAPSTWCGGISGPGIVTYSAPQYKKLRDAHKLPEQVSVEVGPRQGELVKARIYVQAAWDQEGGLRAELGEEWFAFLDMLAKDYDPKNTRLVFWFDS